jgi:ribosomal protein S18 acetylase RimI-like enzyme
VKEADVLRAALADHERESRVASMREPVVREYEERDRAACRRLWAQLTQWHRDLYEDQSIGGDDPASWFDRFRDERQPVGIWVAELDGRVIGFSGALALEHGKRYELEPIVVDAGLRGRGIGSALARAVIDRARADGMRGVEVRPAARNGDAIRFFHAHGFDVLGQLELVLDLAAPERWRRGERLAGRDFRF